jgi:adenosylmethionine-8-amino-7-oxononanoate aminotransferase
VFFTDSGSVAVEVAIKIAVQARLNKGERGRNKILAFTGGYHGDTFGTMAICDPDEGMHSLFTGLLPEHPVIALPRDDASIAAFDAFLEANAHRLAAIITEPLVQGAGGMILHEPEVLRRLRKAADRYGLSLIFDEIFTGFGRTGTMFAFEQADVVPDIITLSKALTGGTLPLAATIATAELFTDFLSDDPQAALMHGPTFMANAMGCAAANASLDLFETEPRLAQALRIENQLTAELNACRALRNVVDVRVKGAIGVVQLSSIPNPAGLRSKLIERGVWIRPFGNVVYLTPALTIEQNELTQLTDAICNVLSAE